MVSTRRNKRARPLTIHGPITVACCQDQEEQEDPEDPE